jgi:hypothetical protein
MAKKRNTTRLLGITVTILIAAYFVAPILSRIAEGFAANTYVITGKLNSNGQFKPMSYPPTLLSPSGSAAGGLKSLTLSGLNPSLKSLVGIAVEYKVGQKYMSPPAAKVDAGGTSLRFESARAPLRLSSARLATTDTTPKLPKSVADMGGVLKILNIEVGNLQGIDMAASENVRVVLSFV